MDITKALFLIESLVEGDYGPEYTEALQTLKDYCTQPTDTQQTQTEISAFITELEDHFRVCADDVKIPYVIERLQKLSVMR